MPYQYQTAANPYALSIADILARRGDVEAQRATAVANAQARAAEVSGNAWGRALDNVGQTISAIPQQIAQQKRDAVQQQTGQINLDAAKANQAGLTRANQIVSSLMTQAPDGTRTIDRAKAQQLMAASNIPLPVQQNIFKALDDTDASVQKYRTAHIDSQADLAHSTIAMIDAGMDPHLAVTTSANVAHANQVISDSDLSQFMQGISQVDPSNIRNVLSGMRAQSEKYKEIDKPVVIPEGGTLATPGGRTIVAGQQKPKTAEELAQDAYLGSLKLPTGTTWESLTSDQRAAFPAWQHAQTVEPPKAGSPEDFVSRARRIALQQNGGQPLSDQQQAAVDAKALEDFRKVNTDPEMRDARLALQAATLAAKDPNGAVNQEKLENAYRTALMRPLSTRSGGLGLEDQKVDQAIHLMALLDQGKDKNGNYNIPTVQLNELALGLARLVSPGGQVGEGMMHDLNQRTAKGDVAGVLTYLTGQPVTGNTQAVIKMFRDSIERQGHVAEGNRQTYLDAIKAMAPTDLAEDRRAQIEKALNLNHLGGAPAASATPVPANVATALKGAGPGKHTLSDGSVWMVDANGNVSPGSR